jgi:hypothetical protein
MNALPRIGVILTGGTIDSVGAHRLDLAWYIEAGKRLGDGELLEQLPELKNIARAQEIAFRRLHSHAIVDTDWLELVQKIHALLDGDEADGIVITHGTNTLEETAYFLNLVLKNRQACRARRLDAAVLGDQRGRIFERRQCRPGSRRPELTRSRVPRGYERHDIQRA